MNYNTRQIIPFSDAATGPASFRRAILHCADSVLRMHVAEKIVSKIFGRNLQSHAAGLVVVMHCEAERGAGQRPTLALVQREMGSARTLAAFFGLLRLAGYVTREPVPGDARSAWLVPAAPLFEGLRQWLSHHARCGEILGLAEPGLAERLRADDAFLRLFLGHARDLFARTREATAGAGAWAWLDRFDCGDRIGLILLGAHHRVGAAAGNDPVWFDLHAREIASRLGLSHSHVRNIVNRSEAEGLLVQDRLKGRVALTPRLLAESEAWFCSFWDWIAETARAAQAAEAAPRG
ncbi:AraC-like DNA-binding protein [Bosea sp. OAE506]